MLKLFRKIRKKLLTENRFTKYLIYALGEIILVVIGILIALQVNNTNEQKKQDREANKIFRQIQDELLQGIIQIQSSRESYVLKDSIHSVITSDTLTLDDYLNPDNRELQMMTYNYYPVTFQKEGFKSYINQVDKFSEKYSSLSKDIKALYVDFEFYIENSQKAIADVLDRQYDYARTQKWFTSVYSIKKVTKEFGDYLLNNHIVRNEVESYKNGTVQLSEVLLKYEKLSIDLYLKLNAMTQYPDTIPEVINNYYASQPDSLIAQLVGQYGREGNEDEVSFEIKLKNNQLYIDDNPISLVNHNRLLKVFDFPYAESWEYNLDSETLCLKVLYKEWCVKKISE